MSLKLKNANVLPLSHETITILGLEVPLTDRLPFGAQVEILDLNAKLDEGEIGRLEWLMRVFCVFTMRLPKPKRVKYDWLAQQDLEPDEIEALTTGTMQLLQALKTDTPEPKEDGAEGNAPKAKRKATKPES